MKWTKEEPTEPGYYWIIDPLDPKGDAIELVLIEDDDGPGCLTIWVYADDEAYELEDIEWFYGPIEICRPDKPGKD